MSTAWSCLTCVCVCVCVCVVYSQNLFSSPLHFTMLRMARRYPRTSILMQTLTWSGECFPLKELTWQMVLVIVGQLPMALPLVQAWQHLIWNGLSFRSKWVVCLYSMVQTWSLVTVSQSIKSFTSSVRYGWIFIGDCRKFTAEYDSRVWSLTLHTFSSIPAIIPRQLRPSLRYYRKLHGH